MGRCFLQIDPGVEILRVLLQQRLLHQQLRTELPVQFLNRLQAGLSRCHVTRFMPHGEEDSGSLYGLLIRFIIINIQGVTYVTDTITESKGAERLD